MTSTIGFGNKQRRSSSHIRVLLCLINLVLHANVSNSFLVNIPRGVVNSRNSQSIIGTNFDTCRQSVHLNAKKKRRRRKDQSGSAVNNKKAEQQVPVPSPSISEDTASDELPDFDLVEEIEENVADANKKAGAPKSTSTSLASFDEISPAMMGNSDQPSKSLNQLIGDRSLESKMQFDDPEDPSIPDIAQLAQASRAARGDISSDEDFMASAGMGKKAAKREARKAAAMANMPDEEEGENPLKKIEFITNEAGEVSPIKILEAGAWLGIFLLVGWEIYINSPLFERAAPMAPVVFEFLY